jgi:hypothetical protein
MINIQILEEIGEEWHKLKGKTDIPIKYWVDKVATRFASKDSEIIARKLHYASSLLEEAIGRSIMDLGMVSTTGKEQPWSNAGVSVGQSNKVLVKGCWTTMAYENI